jgi:two-component system chemotaxis sensor kinase CheA
MQDLPIQAFKEEAYELLSDLEDSLLELEENPTDMDVVGKVFRAMHTIKGSGAMFGFTTISEFTHEIETVYDLVRNAELDVSKELVDLSLQGRDYILELLERDEHSGGQTDTGTKLIAQFRTLSSKEGSSAPESPVCKPSEKDAHTEQKSTYRIRFKPAADILHNGTIIANLLEELTELGECRVVALRSGIIPLDEFEPENCYLSWDAILTSTCDENEIRDVFIFVEDDCELQIDLLEIDLDDAAQTRLGDILINRGEVSPAEIDEIIAKSKKIGDLLVESKLVSRDQVESALVEQDAVRQASQQRGQQKTVSSSLRVPSERLDELVNLVGEMVTVQSRLSQTAAARNDSELLAIAEEVERLTEDLRDSTLNIRMLPIGSTFSKFKRLVRDISHELGKQVELETYGAETELDKTVIDQLNDPLVHIIRNSLDHGIESPEERRNAGKSEVGTVRLSAIHDGDSVIIEIKDDGKGLNAAAIREKAISKGLITPETELTESELFNLVFAPGFSTAAQVTGLSGRGVGMDVVKRSIDSLRGAISLQSAVGGGTTVRLRIPLTLAIIESLLVRIEENRFVLPLSAVEECIEHCEIQSKAAEKGRHLANVRGELVPFVPLRKRFSISGSPPPVQQIVITNINGQRLGFVVDDVIGEHQTVIKSLGPLYRDIQQNISGATILGDGRVALILDVAHIMRQLEDAA